MTLAGVHEVRIHVGAHKTATTHLQRTLARHRSVLRDLGIDFIAPRELRQGVQQHLLRSWLPGARVRAYRDALKLILTGAPVVAISEENLLGNVLDALKPEPYPRLERFAGTMARAVAGPPGQPFVAIRSFDRFWASCYVEALRLGNTPPPLEALCRLARQPPSWLRVCRRLRRIWPERPLTVWRYDDYDARSAASAFLGRDPGPLPGVARAARRASPSDEGVRLALAASGDKEAVGAIFRAHPASSGEPFRPFGSAETAALRDAYARDLEILAADRDIRLILPATRG